VQRDLADTLEAIAREGDAGFYSGATARRIEAGMRKTGLIRREDLAEYRAVLREPLRFAYHGFEVVTMAPPSSGGLAVAQIATLLEQFADGIVERDHRLDADCHRLDPVFVELQPVDQGIVETGLPSPLEIDEIGSEDLPRPRPQQRREGAQSLVLGRGRDRGQDQRRRLGPTADLGDGFSGDGHRQRVRHGFSGALESGA
jgi:hypothetical protein